MSKTNQYLFDKNDQPIAMKARTYPPIVLSEEEDEQLTLEKRQAEAEDRDNDINSGWEPVV